MLIDSTTLQNPFLADLASLADPARYSFLNYCKEEDKIYRRMMDGMVSPASCATMRPKLNQLPAAPRN